MNQPTVTLVRHGQTEWSKTGRHTGLTDVSLTELGRQQARALGDMIGRGEYALVQSSPLIRAWQTMELAGFGEVGEPNPDLVEWDYGEYEGISTAEVREEIPRWTVWTHPVREGETIEEVGERADEVIADLVDSDGPILLFAHGHFLRVLAARWLGLHPDAGQRFSLSTATVSVLGWERENRVLESWNVECHLRSDDPPP